MPQNGGAYRGRIFTLTETGFLFVQTEMSNQIVSSFHPGDVSFLDRGSDTSVLVHLHGATVLSWRCKGQEVLFVSDNAVFDNKKAIRGGIPIVFPNFGTWKHGPQHGFARIKRWRVEVPPTKDHKGNVIAAFSLEDDAETRSMWNFKFKLVYTLELQESSLVQNLCVHNLDKSSFDFTCLLHTYFRTPDVEKMRIMGLQNLTYCDKLKDSAEFKEDRSEIQVCENIDRVYTSSPSEIRVTHVGDGSCDAVLKIFDFPDVVAWNPWVEKSQAMSDFGDDEYHVMLCVEAGCVSKRVVLPPGQSFESSQTLILINSPR
ncbi:putative glucose-6-phosphate 1-epimerase [Gigantopelta aegis]|uniref:putative glucose-6-phosphate 1-epimerase n=1 Tax=Gigantopelta aegis TaxID=1735272 RepID=UPI001B887DB2|nr:putative glucose-6-phosphate 1-epimerase [Gigantopelta aegis]